MDYHALPMPVLLADIHAIALDAEKLFGSLSAEQLNWKPAPDRWSVAQCLEHLINTNLLHFFCILFFSKAY